MPCGFLLRHKLFGVLHCDLGVYFVQTPPQLFPHRRIFRVGLSNTSGLSRLLISMVQPELNGQHVRTWSNSASRLSAGGLYPFCRDIGRNIGRPTERTHSQMKRGRLRITRQQLRLDHLQNILAPAPRQLTGFLPRILEFSKSLVVLSGIVMRHRIQIAPCAASSETPPAPS